MPSADLNCDDLTTTCHLAPVICCWFLLFVFLFVVFFFKGMFPSIFLETTSFESLLFKNNSLAAC